MNCSVESWNKWSRESRRLYKTLVTACSACVIIISTNLLVIKKFTIHLPTVVVGTLEIILILFILLTLIVATILKRRDLLNIYMITVIGQSKIRRYDVFRRSGQNILHDLQPKESWHAYLPVAGHTFFRNYTKLLCFAVYAFPIPCHYCCYCFVNCYISTNLFIHTFKSAVYKQVTRSFCSYTQPHWGGLSSVDLMQIVWILVVIASTLAWIMQMTSVYFAMIYRSYLRRTRRKHAVTEVVFKQKLMEPKNTEMELQISGKESKKLQSVCEKKFQPVHEGKQ